jgi:phage replication O-like protein O
LSKEGFTKVQNEIIERAFCRVNLSAYEWRVLWAIIRKSWGWGDKGGYVSLNELSSRTALHKRHVARTVRSLIEKFIVVTRNGKQHTYYEINMDYHTWRGTWSRERKSPLFPDSRGVPESAPACETSTGTGRVPESAPAVVPESAPLSFPYKETLKEPLKETKMMNDEEVKEAFRKVYRVLDGEQE